MPVTYIRVDHFNGGGSEEVSRQYLVYLLEKYSGNRLTVARALGVSERNIYRLINKFELYS